MLHLDIRAYFPSVDPDRLLLLLEERVHDARFLEVVARVLEAGRGMYDAPEARRFLRLPADHPAGRGLPIGAYTSQVLASWLYLDALDHHVKRRLKVPGYVRYVDDLIVFGDRERDLRRWRAEIATWLREERSLELKHPGAPILPCSGPLIALGHRVTRGGIGPTGRALRRLGAAVREARLRPWDERAERSLRSRVAAAMFG